MTHIRGKVPTQTEIQVRLLMKKQLEMTHGREKVPTQVQMINHRLVLIQMEILQQVGILLNPTFATKTAMKGLVTMS